MFIQESTHSSSELFTCVSLSTDRTQMRRSNVSRAPGISLPLLSRLKPFPGAAVLTSIAVSSAELEA